MGTDTITRKCAHCKEPIIVHRDNLCGIALCNKKYYHTDCLAEVSKRRALSKRCSPSWLYAVDHLEDCENDAKVALQKQWEKDDLNKHILQHYDITAIPSRFWTTIEQVVNGTYKGKSKPMPYGAIVACWRDLQKYLDKIHSQNNRAGKEILGASQLNYDLAIVINKYPVWVARKRKQQAEVINMEKTIKTEPKIDYSQIKTESTSEGLDDINSLLDEL